jgi:TPR repeat protein
MKRSSGAWMRRTSSAILCLLGLLSALPSARADSLANASRAYARHDYVRAARDLSYLAQRGNAKAQGILGFMYENGFGVPQSYDAAADLYARAADQGDPFGQAMLGLMFDKGHGVPQSFVLACKWLNLAAARAPKRDRDYYLRLRNAVASKMTSYQVVEAQRLALSWTPGRW